MTNDKIIWTLSSISGMTYKASTELTDLINGLDAKQQAAIAKKLTRAHDALRKANADIYRARVAILESNPTE